MICGGGRTFMCIPILSNPLNLQLLNMMYNIRNLLVHNILLFKNIENIFSKILQ